MEVGEAVRSLEPINMLIESLHLNLPHTIFHKDLPDMISKDINTTYSPFHIHKPYTHRHTMKEEKKIPPNIEKHRRVLSVLLDFSLKSTSCALPP